MNRCQRMEKLLRDAFSPTFLEIEDQSAQHAGHAGARPSGETHYHVVIAADVFGGKSRVAVHREVMAALKTEFSDGLHALSIEIRR